MGAGATWIDRLFRRNKPIDDEEDAYGITPLRVRRPDRSLALIRSHFALVRCTSRQSERLSHECGVSCDSLSNQRRVPGINTKSSTTARGCDIHREATANA